MHKTTNCDARLLLPTSSLTPPMTLVSFQFDEARRGTPQCPLIQTLSFLYCKQNQQKQQVQNGRTKYHSQSSYDQNGSIKGNPCDRKEKNMALTPKTIYNKQKSQSIPSSFGSEFSIFSSQNSFTSSFETLTIGIFSTKEHEKHFHG